MVQVTSYNSLVSAAQLALEDESTEFLDFLPVAIDNAENRLTRELDILDLVYTSTIIASASTPTFSKPTGHLATRFIKYKDPTTGRSTVISRRSESYISEFWPQETSVGIPRYYTEEGSTSFRIAPCVSADASVTIMGIKKPTALSSANTTNIFTSSYADALFYATMIESAVWSRNDTLLNNYSQLYIAARDNINNVGKRQRRDDTSPVTNPIMQQNTLQNQNNQ